MSVLLIMLAVFFGLVVWCAGTRLCPMLLAAARDRRVAAVPAPHAVPVRKQ